MISAMDKPNQEGKAIEVLIGTDRDYETESQPARGMEYILKRYYYISSSGQCHRVRNRSQKAIDGPRGRHETGCTTKLSFIRYLSSQPLYCQLQFWHRQQNTRAVLQLCRLLLGDFLHRQNIVKYRCMDPLSSYRTNAEVRLTKWRRQRSAVIAMLSRHGH